MLNLRGQLFANMAEARQAIFRAPDIWTGVTRASKLLGGAIVLGTATKTLRDMVTGQFGEVKGNAKDLAKRIGDEAAAQFIDNLVYGLGTIATDVALTGYASSDEFRWASAIVGVPMTQIQRLSTLREDPLRTGLKIFPSPVPLDQLAEEEGIIPKKRKR